MPPRPAPRTWASDWLIYGYGQYDKAVDFISKGVTKGGLKNDAEAHLLLGIAQLKGGHKDEAVKSFKAVKGDSDHRAAREPLGPAREAGVSSRRSVAGRR